MTRSVIVTTARDRAVILKPGFVQYLTDDNGEVLTTDVGEPIAVHDVAVHSRIVRVTEGG